MGKMKYNKITALYFSPTGSTKNALKTVLDGFSCDKSEIDFTPYENRNNSYSFTSSDLVIIAVPVYGGRIPSAAEQRIKQMHGENTQAILFVSYGNVHFGNSLCELQQLIEINGFITIAAAAVVTEHNVIPDTIGVGRPSANDKNVLLSFSRQVQDKISANDKIERIILNVDKKYQYSQRDTLPIRPHSSKQCNKCGVCIKGCPCGAILVPEKATGSQCIRCMRCIKYCPKKVRTFGFLKKIPIKLFLKIMGRKEKETLVFL